MPLAVLLHKSGHRVTGSDRSCDQGKTPEKFQALRDLGITLFPQDGSGIANDVDQLVVSSAIEETIPDVRAARDLNIPVIKRGALLAEMFNAARQKIAVAGTSGKSSVTGMIATILEQAGKDPTVVNGGEIINFRTGVNDRFSSVRKGRPDLFVAEMDESDSSIAQYTPAIAVLNNIALDHKSMTELELLFGDYLVRTTGTVVANYDDTRVKSLCESRVTGKIISYAVDERCADFTASRITPGPYDIAFIWHAFGREYDVTLNVPGRYNVYNALAALGACCAAGIEPQNAAQGLRAFRGIHRRMEYIGTRGGITVIDDFAHNPDKIAASLEMLKAFDGRLIVMFQPHGYGPLRLMGNEMVRVFARYLDAQDYLLMPEVYYAGGTAERSVTAQDIVEGLKKDGVNAHWFAERGEILPFIRNTARSGDRIIIMGARDDTLHVFAHDVLGTL